MYRYEQLMCLLIFAVTLSFSFDCRSILEDKDIMYLNWENLERCLKEVSGESLPMDVNTNIWRLVKRAFDGIDNIPPEVYKSLGLALTAIPLNELFNISMERVETVEAFGAISRTFNQEGFSKEHIQIIAEKVRFEWMGKNPHTYSQYDVMSMGELLCYLNVSDIENIHADVLREAAEWIGSIENCPQSALEALAKLATADEAFGPPSKWSKLQVITLGNIINGLPSTDLASIDKNKLHLNRFHKYNKVNGTNDENTKSTVKNQTIMTN